jgi:ABC-type transport system involved in cytochrome bd biosynthesis fused ATPase/permease subunit
MNLLKLSRIVLIICFVYAVSVNAGCIACIGLLVTLNYSLGNILVFGISWTIIWGIWSYHSCKADFYFPGYFFIICYHFKIRLTSIEKRLKNFAYYSKQSSMRAKISTIRCLLRDHNNLCQQIDEQNQYWKKYLTLTYLIFVSSACFVLYAVFISPVKWFVRIEYLIVLSAILLLLIIITYSASSVSYFNEIIFRDLNSVCVRNSFPISFKLKVRLKLKRILNR